MKELIQAMINFKKDVGIIIKDCKGQTGNRTFEYADLATFDDAINDSMFKHKLWVNQYLQQMEGHTHLVTNLYHESGQCIHSDCRLDYTGKDIKEFGGVISYYRRYALQTILNLVTDKAENVTKTLNPEDMPAGSLTKKEVVEVKTVDIPKLDTQQKLNLLIQSYENSYNKNEIRDFIYDRATVNKRSLDENILEFYNNAQAFHAEMKNWKKWKEGQSKI